MNIKSIITLLAFFGWGWYSWNWLKDKQLECGCTLSTTTSDQTTSTPATAEANNLPLSFNWSSDQPIQGNGYESFYKSKLANVGNGDTLLIRTWYYDTEDNGLQLAMQRGEKLKALYQDSLANRIKVVTEMRTLTDSSYKTQSFIAADFGTIRNTNAPAPLVEETDEKVIVRFASNSNAKQLEAEIDAALTRLADKLKANPAMKATVTGHTDNVGDDAKNMDLSKQRAEFVKGILVSKGADGANLTADAKGETEPVASNDIEGGRKLNRRVEINIQK